MGAGVGWASWAHCLACYIDDCTCWCGLCCATWLALPDSQESQGVEIVVGCFGTLCGSLAGLPLIAARCRVGCAAQGGAGWLYVTARNPIHWLNNSASVAMEITDYTASCSPHGVRWCCSCGLGSLVGGPALAVICAFCVDLLFSGCAARELKVPFKHLLQLHSLSCPHCGCLKPPRGRISGCCCCKSVAAAVQVVS